MQWSREEYIDLLTFQKCERPMFVELFGPLVGLEEEWRAQGASDEEISLVAFDFDYVRKIDCGGNTGILGGCKPYVVEETSEYKIAFDEYGRKTKLCKRSATIPLPLTYPVKDMDSWLKIKHWFEYRKERIDMLSSKGTKLFSQDSDGNMNSVLDTMIESGVNVSYPCEPAAGMDIVALRKKYGRKLAFKGGIDKHTLREDKEAIRKELEYKLQPHMREGNVFGLDHRIPNGVTLENYRYYVDTARELLELPKRKDGKGWTRMAF